MSIKCRKIHSILTVYYLVLLTAEPNSNQPPTTPIPPQQPTDPSQPPTTPIPSQQPTDPSQPPTTPIPSQQPTDPSHPPTATIPPQPSTSSETPSQVSTQPPPTPTTGQQIAVVPPQLPTSSIEPTQASMEPVPSQPQEGVVLPPLPTKPGQRVTSQRCNTLNQRSLDGFLLSVLKNSFARQNAAMIWIDREALIALLHRATEFIAGHDHSLVIFAEYQIPQERFYVVGSLDGDLDHLVAMLNQCDIPPYATYIFLGDYLGTSGPRRIEALLVLLVLKMRFPKNIYLLRGHQETYEMCKATAFDEYCGDERIFYAFIMLFEYLPLVAWIGRFLCLHSGISPFMSNPHYIEQFVRPTEVKRMTASERCLLTDILYGTPYKNLEAPFAPSIDYPIGFRFNMGGLRAVFRLFGCKKLIRGCGARGPTGFISDFETLDCVTIASGCDDNGDQSQPRRCIIEIHRKAQMKTVALDPAGSWRERSYDEFIETLNCALQNKQFQYQLPSECLVCGWNAIGKQLENVTISHTELSILSEEMSERRLAYHYITEPRIRQYLYAELFPFCADEYFFGSFFSEMSPIGYMIPTDTSAELSECRKRPTPGQINSVNQTFPGFEVEKDKWPYPYTSQIVRPGHSMEEPEAEDDDDDEEEEEAWRVYSLRESRSHNVPRHQWRSLRDRPRFRSRREWLDIVRPPLLRYQYRVERAPYYAGE